MNFTTSVLQKEGFDAILRITFENGLVLNTENFIWSGKKRGDEIKTQFEEVVELLRTKSCSQQN
jgi:hypothetical protein